MHHNIYWVPGGVRDVHWSGGERSPSHGLRSRGARRGERLRILSSVCESVRIAKTQKVVISRFFSFWAQNRDFCVFERQIAKKVKFCTKVSKMRFLRFWLPKVSINDKVFHSFCQVASPRAKNAKKSKKSVLGAKNQKWLHFHNF